jgi:hypothetical protein
MIIINLIGGLGNQMFQYAASKALALQQNKKLVINTKAFHNYKLHQYGLYHFNISESYFTFFDQILIQFAKLFSRVTYYNETEFQFNPNLSNLSNLTNNHLILNGYFQSENYFSNFRDEILKSFTLKTEVKEKTKQLLGEINLQNSVSLHIRRGDYLNLEVHNTDKSTYYEKAIQYIAEEINQPVFYIFSDDMPWVKENFKLNYKTIYVDFNDANSNYEDLKLMSSCKHNIIANSSFSWWSAWLNTNPDKIVIAPKNWFATDQYNAQDVIPETWIQF